MFGRLVQLRRRIRNGFAWLGLLLMIVSFARLEWISSNENPVVPMPRAPKGESFTVVVLDPGHGGQDSGAMCAGILEKDLTLDIAKRTDRLLQAMGLSTVMTRVGDSYVSLADRAALTNRVRNCIFVSIHFNEGNKPVSSGIETYYAERQTVAGTATISWLPFLRAAATEIANSESQNLAGFVQQALVTRTQAVNRGTKAQQFFVISNVRHPAVLVEGGFLSNKEDIAKLTSDGYREQIAAAISEGIIGYRDLLKQRQPSPPANSGEGAE